MFNHCCPVKNLRIGLNILIYMEYLPNAGFFDLKIQPPFSGYNPPNHRFGGSHNEYRGNRFFSTDPCPTSLYLRQMRSTLPRKQKNPYLLLLGSISLYGLCSTDLTGISPRHRNRPEFSSAETLPHGYTGKNI